MSSYLPFIVGFVFIVAALNYAQRFILYMPYRGGKGNWEYGNTTGSGETTFLFFHGNVGNCLIQNPDTIAKIIPGVYHTFEYPGYGFNSDQSINKDTIINRASAALKSVATPRKPIYIIGQSLGSGVAAEVAKLYPSLVKGIILITPYTRMMDVINSYVPLVGNLLFSHRYNCIDNAKGYVNEGGKVLVIGASDDTVIPPKHSEEISTVCGCDLVSFTGGHNGFQMKSSVWRDSVELFIRKSD